MPVTVTNGIYFSMSFETFMICIPIVLVYDRKHKGLEEDDATRTYYNNLSMRKKWLC